MTETTIPSVNGIRALVQTAKGWAVKALIMLANQQTPDEFAAGPGSQPNT